MKRNDLIYIKEILEQIGLIQEYTKGISEAIFKHDLNLRDATLRRLEIIGEASKQVSEKTKKKYPEIEWKSISGTRDILIHSYFGVDVKLVWRIVKKDIPVLKKQMKKIEKELMCSKD